MCINRQEAAVQYDHRLGELDSLRGLAALAVVGHHYLLILPQVYAAILPIYDPSAPQPHVSHWWLVFTPLHLLWGGTEAVALFFVLSGFVLALPFFSQTISYTGFVIKRICRIYPAYLTAVLGAILLSSFLAGRPVGGLSPWFQTIWRTPVTGRILLDHILLIGNFRNGIYDPVVWSLVHEIRISLVFPLIMIPVIRWNWKLSLVVSEAIAVLGAFLPFGPSLVTLQYLPMFVAGAVLAKHRSQVNGRVARLSPRLALGLTALGVSLYTYAWWFFPHSTLVHPAFGLTFGRLLNDLATCSGAVLFLALAQSRTEAKVLLLRRPLVWLGRVSYSIYLFHAVALFSLTYLLYPRVALIFIWPLAIGVTAVTASASHRFIEVPWINLGRRWASKDSETLRSRHAA